VRIKLFDFGIAKVPREARRLVGPVIFPTREGTCLGTPRYVSPEQAIGLDVDRRTDIYAAGMLLYTLVAGRGPFDEIVGVQRVLEAHIGQEPPPPSRFVAAPLAPSIEAVILRAIAKNPAERFDDVATFRRELGRAWAEARRGAACGRHGGRSRARRPAFDHKAASYAHRPAFDRCRIRPRLASLPHVPYGTLSGRAVDAPSLPPADLAAPASTAPDSETRLWSGAKPPAPQNTGIGAIPAASTDGESFAPKSDRTRARRATISRRGVLCSAAAFFAVAGGLAMWFVR
jgi:serine/threonine protein kinase